MRYEEPVYRPPSEADSLLIQATIGCPHNKCTFCGMYKGKKFRIRAIAEIKEDIISARQFYGDNVDPVRDRSPRYFRGDRESETPTLTLLNDKTKEQMSDRAGFISNGVESIFFPDGNTIIMKTAQLEEIFRFSYETFQKLKRITLYGSAKFIKFKSLEDLKRLKEAGLKRIHKGLESGNDEVLRRLHKGADSKLMIETGKRVKEAGIELSEYVLVGIGGKELWQEHSIDTAKVLNAINPDFIRLRTWVPVPAAPLYQDYQDGRFQLLSPYEALKETRLLLEHLEVTGLFLSDHISNYVNISGHLPRDKKSMLSRIDKALKMDETSFRPAPLEMI